MFICIHSFVHISITDGERTLWCNWLNCPNLCLLRFKQSAIVEMLCVMFACSVLKVGVACVDDARYLLTDYNLDCVGCVDLRHLVPRTLPSAAKTYVE